MINPKLMTSSRNVFHIFTEFVKFQSKTKSILNPNLTKITVEKKRSESRKKSQTMKYSDKTDKHTKILRIFWNFPEIPAFREKMIHLLKTRKITLVRGGSGTGIRNTKMQRYFQMRCYRMTNKQTLRMRRISSVSRNHKTCRRMVHSPKMQR